jgi:hypothetical protein
MASSTHWEKSAPQAVLGHPSTDSPRTHPSELRFPGEISRGPNRGGVPADCAKCVTQPKAKPAFKCNSSPSFSSNSSTACRPSAWPASFARWSVRAASQPRSSRSSFTRPRSCRAPPSRSPLVPSSTLLLLTCCERADQRGDWLCAEHQDTHHTAGSAGRAQGTRPRRRVLPRTCAHVRPQAIQQRLKTMSPGSFPANGVAIYCGADTAGEDSARAGKIECHVLVPLQPLQAPVYQCGKTFLTQVCVGSADCAARAVYPASRRRGSMTALSRAHSRSATSSATPSSTASSSSLAPTSSSRALRAPSTPFSTTSA